MSDLKTADFWVGDAVEHVHSNDRGLVMHHNHARGLIKVRWESRAEEWVPAEELVRLTKRESID